MSESVSQRLRSLRERGCVDCLRNALHGIEKESLRVDAAGHIAKTPHPPGLGSALTHERITTDYSEALLEFVTPPYRNLGETLDDLMSLHAHAAQILREQDEMLWATSMPCVLGGDADIPIAEYGSSNSGRMRHVYRRGLGYRYGRAMQVISGVHYNFSLPESFWKLFARSELPGLPLREVRDRFYFGLIRNFQRRGWLLPFLFGASPAVCKSFLQGGTAYFEAFDSNTLYDRWATSLRMSDIGYKNKNQAGLGISYNDLESYTRTLERATRTPDPEYERIGLRADGEYRQLNANLLQIENEYYSFIRPKQPTRPGERPVHALRRRGVDYIEVRALDVNAFHPLGVDAPQLRFVEAFLIYCLLLESPPLSVEEEREIDVNQERVACRGRQPGLRLLRDARTVSLQEWAGEILSGMEGICELLDENHAGSEYREALDIQKARLEDPDRTPSARMLAEMRDREMSFFDYALELSRQHMRTYLEHPLDNKLLEQLRRDAATSLERQREIEAGEELDFEAYLARYFEPLQSESGEDAAAPRY